MTTDPDLITRAHEEHLMAAFAVVLAHPARFAVVSSEQLKIERIENDRFRVLGPSGEELFDDVREAVGYYLDLADQWQPRDTET